MNKLSTYGSTGFIGSKYCNLFTDTISVPREQNEPKNNNILYFISTTHNYHVFDNLMLKLT